MRWNCLIKQLFHRELERTISEQLIGFPLPLIVNCDDYKCHKSDQLREFARNHGMFIYITKGGLTPCAQVWDAAGNGIVHQYVEAKNMERMLSAPLDSRGYPICMTRVELAHSVCEGLAKVTPEIIMRSAVKCGVARWFDFKPADVERARLRDVKVSPIIADLVSNEEMKPTFDLGPPVTVDDPLNVELYNLGEILGLDPDIEEEREELENFRFAQESLETERYAAENGEDAEELDIDYGTVIDKGATPIEDEASISVEDSAPRKRRRMYSREQLDILNREFLKGTAGGRMKNADIAKEINRLNGAREVNTTDVRNWMVNQRHHRVAGDRESTHSEGESNFKRDQMAATDGMRLQVKRLDQRLS